MTEEELFDLLKTWDNIDLVVQELKINTKDFDVLMSLALHNTEKRSWRAAYLVDKIHDEKPELMLPYLPAIIEQLKTETDAGKRRHWLKLISMNKTNAEQEGFLVDFCINTFTSSKEAIAVRVHAMQILYNISENQPGLKPELLAIIEHEMENHPTPGILSRGSKLVKKLRQQVNNF